MRNDLDYANSELNEDELMGEEKFEGGFASTYNKGFRIDFKNGFGISVQWGPGNYSENRDKDWEGEPGIKSFNSTDAEIAVFDNNEKDGYFINLGKSKGAVLGYVDSTNTAKVIEIVASAKDRKEIVVKIEKLDLFYR